jgi:quaternary ammonium compound-resistance protein SugE
MAWLFLILAGVCEVGWAVGLKKYGFTRTPGGVVTVIVMLLSFVLLDRAMRHLPLGTAYGVWTGIGAIGTAIIGILAFGESRDWKRLVCLGLVLAGIVGLKLLSPGREN